MVTRHPTDGNARILPIYHSNQELKYDFAQLPRFFLSSVSQISQILCQTQVQASLQI